jgi:predicted PurR-regulated permease PerM
MQASPAGRPLTLAEYTLRIVVALLLLVLLLALWRLREALLLTFLAVLVAIALHVPVQRLEQMGLSRGMSVLITVGGVFTILTLLGILIVPVLVTEISALLSDLPDAVEQTRLEYDHQVANSTWLPEIDWDRVAEGDVPQFILEQVGNVPRNIFPFLSGLGGVLANVIFITFVSLFFIIDPTNYMTGLLRLVPNGYRPRALTIFVELGDTLQRWFIGQMISMVMSGTMIAFVMGVIIGLPNPVALGMITGLAEFVPYFGAFFSVIPGVLIALAEDPALVPWVLLGYLLTQQVQSNLIMPQIMKRQVSMPAAMVLIMQVSAAALFGFMGLLMAVPLAVVVMVLVREVYVYDVLNTRDARIEARPRPDGSPGYVVLTERYRPEQLSPGEAASLQAQGQNPFDVGERQVVEIITPASPDIERMAQNQRAVWLALLALLAAEGIALVRSLLRR